MTNAQLAAKGSGNVYLYSICRRTARLCRRRVRRSAALGVPIVTAFPFATLAVNAAGSLAMGLLAGWLARHGGGGGEQLRLLLGVGLLGGFTTFSAFSLEMVMLLERGNYLFALLYGILSIAMGITGLMVGLGVMRMAG